MGLFDLFKKKEQPTAKKENKILLAMPMFNNGESLDFNKAVDYLKNNWECKVSDINDDKILTVDGEMVALMAMPAQIPWDDIKGTAQYAYNWPTAEKDLENHNSHVIVTIMSSNKSDLERFKIMTKVLSSICSTSNCIGVYIGAQSLLIPKAQYIESAESLKTDHVPLELWIYIGIRKTEQGNTIYTYGLRTFDKLEMEIINSKLGIEEIHGFLSNICAYVINSNITFRNGETLGYTADQKVKLTISKGQFVDGETIKLEM